MPAPLFSFTGIPGGVAAGADRSIHLSAHDSGTLWRLDPAGAGEPFAGGRRPGQGGARGAGLFAPAGLAAGPDGSLVVADPGRHRICAVDPDGTVRVIAGGVSGYRDAPAGQAMFRHPADVAVAPDGTCYVADTGNHRIRAISPDGVVTTVAGSIYDFGDGTGAHGRFRLPAALDVDGRGVVYVADTGNNAVRRIDPDGRVTTLAGGAPGGDRDGRGPYAALRWPTGIAAAPDGSVWVADSGNGTLRRVGPEGPTVTVIRMTGSGHPGSVAVLPDGAVAVAGVSLGGPGGARGFVAIHRDSL